MSFLPGNLTPALLRSYRRKVVSPFRRSFNFEIGICFMGVAPCQIFCENKKADYAEHHKLAGAWLSLQSDVLCNRLLIQSRVLLRTAPANRTNGVMEQFGTSGVPIPCRMNRLIMSQYGRTFLFSCLCGGIPTCQYYTDETPSRQDLHMKYLPKQLYLFYEQEQLACVNNQKETFITS